MTAEYGTYAPLTPRTMSQNRNSAIASPRTRTPAGTNVGIPGQRESSVRKSMNVPTATAPGGHRQTAYGGRTSTLPSRVNSASGYGRSPTEPSPSSEYGLGRDNPYTRAMERTPPRPQEESLSPQNPIVEDAFQAQLAQMNRIRNRGQYGMAIPRGNPQGVKPMSVYSRPAEGRRY